MIPLLEKAIAAISPHWACERAFYAESLRAYEAGEVTRFNDGWVPINEDTENADKTQRDLIKARARYLERNSDIAVQPSAASCATSLGRVSSRRHARATRN